MGKHGIPTPGRVCGLMDVYTWGGEAREPQLVAGLSECVDTACGAAHGLSRDADGKVFAWGWNSHGQLGTGDTEDLEQARIVVPLQSHRVVSISCGAGHSLAVTHDGAVFAWCAGSAGQLGLGEAMKSKVLQPTQVRSLRNIARVSCGAAHSAAWSVEQGTAYLWGRNAHGQCGCVHSSNVFLPHLMEPKVRMISCGGAHSVLLSAVPAQAEGDVLSCGLNSTGQLGVAAKIPSAAVGCP